MTTTTAMPDPEPTPGSTYNGSGSPLGDRTGGHEAERHDTSVVLATRSHYEDAEAVVDQLSDTGFPVGGVAIVGRGLTSVEVVTGRLTRGRAAGAGALGGVWLGLLLGLLLGLFVPAVSWLALMLSAVAFGAFWGAVIGFVGHWMTRGRRDFASQQTLRAGAYDVRVPARLYDDALQVLYTSASSHA
jgi:hypothetical protein